MIGSVIDNLDSWFRSIPPLMLPVALALAGGVLVYLLSRISRTLCKLLALVVSLGVFVAGGSIISGAMDRSFTWEWLSLTKEISFSVNLVPTVLGMTVLVGAAIFATLITIYSFRAMAGSYWEGKFYAYLLWALGGACIVALAGNLLVLFIGWELVTLMLFLMVNQGAGDAKAGGAKAYGVLGFADACLLLALALLAAMDGGSANWSLTRGPVVVSAMGPAGYVVYVLIMTTMSL